MPTTIRGALIVAAASLLIPFAALAQDKGGKAAPPLPDGKGKQLVEGICAACHALQLIPNSSGYTRDHWKELVGYMIDLSGSPAQQNEILDYLAANFPPNKRRAAKLVPGKFQVTFKEWVMPQLGQRTRDPIQAADGSIWYAGQFGNLIGRLDPKTGQAKEYPLPPNAMPHTVQLDPKGRPWFSGNKNGSIGWVDPASGKATVYKMPDPEATDVHTITFDKKGMVYFTFQWANMIGRLNPDTGDIKLVKVAAQRSQPYDIKFDREGTLWVSCNARPCLLKVNPDTLDITEVKLPLPSTTVRRFDIAPDGTIWYVNSGAGRIGRLNPKIGRDQGMGFALRPALAPLRHRGARRRRLVQRVRHAARPAGALRHRDGNIPELADQVRQRLRRHPAQRAHHAARHAAHPPDRHQPHHRGDAAARARGGAVGARFSGSTTAWQFAGPFCFRVRENTT